MKPVSTARGFGAVLLVILVMFSYSNSAIAEDTTPLRPADTSSLRAMLNNFIMTVESVYRTMHDLLLSYSQSGRLYLNVEARASSTSHSQRAGRSSITGYFQGAASAENNGRGRAHHSIQRDS